VHQRLTHEFLLRLSKRALWVISPALREDAFRDAFEAFHAVFKDELDWYEFERERNEFLLRLARRAVRTIAFCLREEEMRDAFEEFQVAFKEELDWYEFEKERMAARLAGRAIRKDATDENGNGAVPGDQEQAAGEKP
jgi:hypothetical protein